MDDLMKQIATNAADYAVGHFGQYHSKAKQIRLWKRHYDTAYASLITFDDLQRARRVRATTLFSDN